MSALGRTLALPEVERGTELPELVLPLSATTVVSTAIATRDFQPVHHDPERARAQGSADVFLNILTTIGLVQRFVTDWAGPEALVGGISIRLGAPAYAGDILTLTGHVTDVTDGAATVEVRGTVSLGDHVTGTARVRLPGHDAVGGAA